MKKEINKMRNKKYNFQFIKRAGTPISGAPALMLLCRR